MREEVMRELGEMAEKYKNESVKEITAGYVVSSSYQDNIWDRKLLNEERELLNNFIDKVSENFADKVKEVCLFGSKARGDAGTTSDIDLLVLVNSEGLWKPLHELADEVEYQLSYPGFISLAIYHIDQWEELAENKSPFIERCRKKALLYGGSERIVGIHGCSHKVFERSQVSF